MSPREPRLELGQIRSMVTVGVFSSDENDRISDLAKTIPRVVVVAFAVVVGLDFGRTLELPAVLGVSKAMIDVEIEDLRVPILKGPL